MKKLNLIYLLVENINELSDSDIFLEAVNEDLNLKKNIFKQLNDMCVAGKCSCFSNIININY